MAVRLLDSAPPILLSPSRLFLHRHLAGDELGGSLRLQSPTKLHFPLRISLTRGSGAARSSQDTAGFLSGFNPREITSVVHTRAEDSAFVEGDMHSDHPNIWKQMKEIALFAAPAAGLWICGPLMSLIDTMVVGQGSSLELAALGPGTVFCDNLSYIFMFLSISTSNMVATSLAKKDKNLAQHQISMLLFVAFASGVGMLLFTKLFGVHILTDNYRQLSNM